MNSKSLDIIKNYLSGDISLESAAEELHRGGNFAIGSQPDGSGSTDHARLEELMGRLLWLTLRALSPDGAPETPFGAVEIREMASGVFFDKTSEEPSDDKDSDSAGPP
ncbi:MAG: hypothetical protein ABJC63_08325 [Gemmatimonadales bacterium]